MEQLYTLVARLARDLNTNLSNQMASAIEKRDWLAFDQIKVAPGDFTDPESYWQHAQLRDLLRKIETLDTGLPLEKMAQDEFLRCETANYITNRRIDNLLLDKGLMTSSDLRIHEFFMDVRKEIAWCLGKLPDFEELSDVRFGPGATFSERRPVNLIADKNSNLPVLTPEAWPFIPDWEQTAWARSVRHKRQGIGYSFNDYCENWSEPQRVRGNRFTTVPKDGFKRRGICIEPSLNVFYQLGIGSFIRKRLKRKFLIDLKRDQFRHRMMARWGSSHGGLATIDLTSASDLISLKLVKALMPPLWFELLSSLRSPFTLVNGKWHRLEKFSSMGNGFTFELETLIYNSICRIVLKRRGFDPDELVRADLLGQYGDDCVVPIEVAEDVLAVFRWCGFQPNLKKTFIDGPFRESCGGDYHSNVDVRTYKITGDIDEPAKWISFLNGIWSVARPDVHCRSRLPFIRRLYRFGLASLPNHIRRLKGPDHLGDLVIHGTLDSSEVLPSVLLHGIRYYKGWMPISNVVPWRNFSPGAMLASALYGASSTGLTSSFEPVTGYKATWIGVPDRKIRRALDVMSRQGIGAA